MNSARLTIVSTNGSEKEVPLEGRETVLGRSGTSDVRLKDPHVSRRHARLARYSSDYYLEDLNSKNGTLFNGHHIRRRLLQDGDQFEIGHYRMEFSNPQDFEFGGLDKPDSTETKTESSSQSAGEGSKNEKKVPGPAYVYVIRGADKGQTKPVDKILYTISDTTGQLATISRRPTGYYLLRLGGGTVPYINNRPLEAGGEKLYDGDVIEFGGSQFRFVIPETPVFKRAN